VRCCALLCSWCWALRFSRTFRWSTFAVRLIWVCLSPTHSAGGATPHPFFCWLCCVAACCRAPVLLQMDSESQVCASEVASRARHTRSDAALWCVDFCLRQCFWIVACTWLCYSLTSSRSLSSSENGRLTEGEADGNGILIGFASVCVAVGGQVQELHTHSPFGR
jgi:hypothetical protein